MFVLIFFLFLPFYISAHTTLNDLLAVFYVQYLRLYYSLKGH